MNVTAIEKTFLQVRIFNADQIKKSLSEQDWMAVFDRLYRLVADVSDRRGGQIVRFATDGLLLAFPSLAVGAQAAIELQESLETDPENLSLAIGIAAGQAYRCSIDPNGHEEYLGSPVDIAVFLAHCALGKAILLHYPLANPADKLDVHSKAGGATNRSAENYFTRQPSLPMPSRQESVACYSLVWQWQPSHFLTTKPIGDLPAPPAKQAMPPKDQLFFGRISAFKKERGFGFIQYYNEDQEYHEIYFHMTYVINQVPVQEHDHVQFTVKPGKEGRPQACSVLVMGSRLQGQMESLQSDGSGRITIHNQDLGLIRFFVLPLELQSLSVDVDDLVEFTVGSGSDIEGLIALDIKVCASEESHSDVVGAGDHLQIGSIERAVITVYFSEKGYGFAKCRRNNVYVHVSELNTPENVPNPGDIIEFEVFPGRDGTYRANNVRMVMKKGLTP